MKITMEFARQDDCLDKMVPSDLRQLIGDKDRAEAEIVLLKAQLASLQVINENQEIACNQLIDQRDNYHEYADKLAGAISEFFSVDIGEHTSACNPWQNAFDAINSMHIDNVRHIWESRNCGSCSELAEKHDALAARVAVLTDYIQRGAPINTNPDKCERKALLNQSPADCIVQLRTETVEQFVEYVIDNNLSNTLDAAKYEYVERMQQGGAS